MPVGCRWSAGDLPVSGGSRAQGGCGGNARSRTTPTLKWPVFCRDKQTAGLVCVSKPSEGITATVVGVVVLLIGATTVFGELQDALDRIWRAPTRDRSGGWWGLLRARLLSFGMIAGIAFLLMVSLVLSAGMAALGKWWGGMFGGWEVLAQLVNAVLNFGLTTAVFAFLYKLMPRVKVEWHDLWLGAAVTALMFTVGKAPIGLRGESSWLGVGLQHWPL